jgi:hypothetical protein
MNREETIKQVEAIAMVIGYEFDVASGSWYKKEDEAERGIHHNDMPLLIAGKLQSALHQRFIALTNAFNTIDAFAAPSLSPDEFEKYEEVKSRLINQYLS